MRIDRLLAQKPHLTKDKVERDYITNYRPLNELRIEYGISRRSMVDLVRHYGLPMSKREGRQKSYACVLRDKLAKFPFATREFFVREYAEKQGTLPVLLAQYGIDYKSTLFFLHHYGIPARDSTEAANLPGVRRRYEDTCREKFGCDNVSQNDAVKRKKADTFTEHYGVDNIWKTKEYYQWLDAFMIERYGQKRICGWANLPPEEREAFIVRSVKKMHAVGKQSSLELRIAAVLEAIQLDYERHFYIGRLQYDFYIRSLNLIIEVNGDFWHANPIKYAESDLLPAPNTDGVAARDIWAKDERKRQIALAKGHVIVYIWETEIRKASHLTLLVFEKIRAAYNAIHEDQPLPDRPRAVPPQGGELLRAARCPRDARSGGDQVDSGQQAPAL